MHLRLSIKQLLKADFVTIRRKYDIERKRRFFIFRLRKTFADYRNKPVFLASI